MVKERQLVDRPEYLGFRPLALETYSLREKAWILNRAEVVIGLSGAGMSNIVFCEPGTVVVELRVQPFPILDVWDIANRRGLKFFVVRPVEFQSTADPNPVRTSDIDPEDVVATLELAAVTPRMASRTLALGPAEPAREMKAVDESVVDRRSRVSRHGNGLAVEGGGS